MRDGLVRVMQKAGLSVSVSEEEGQRVLDLARGVDNSEEMREQREDERFKEDLGRYERGEMEGNELFHLGMPRGVLSFFLMCLSL